MKQSIELCRVKISHNEKFSLENLQDFSEIHACCGIIASMIELICRLLRHVITQCMHLACLIDFAHVYPNFGVP